MMVLKRQSNFPADMTMKSEVAALKLQFSGLSEQVKGLFQSQVDGFSNVNNQFVHFGSQLEKLSDKIAAPRHIPWTPILGGVAIVVTIGIALITFGFNSIQSGMSDIKLSLASSIEKNDARFTGLIKDTNAALSEKVSKTDLKFDNEVRDARSAEFRLHVEAETRSLHDEMVPRLAYDERGLALRRELDDLKRRIDQLSDRWVATKSP